jgi:hypothetical protein
VYHEQASFDHRAGLSPMLDAASPFKTELRRRDRAVWTGGAIGLAIWMAVLAVLERVGLPDAIIAPLVAVPAFLAIAVAGIASRTMLLAEYDVAGRTLPAGASALSLGAFAAGLLLVGGDPVFMGLGTIVGLLLAGLVFGPAFHRSGAATLGEWLGGDTRFGRIVAGLFVAGCAFPALAGLVGAVADGLARHLALEPAPAIALTCGILAIAGMFGGWRGFSAAQLASAVVGGGAALAALAAALKGGAIEAAPDFMQIAQPGRAATFVLGTALGLAASPSLFAPFAAAESASEGRKTALGAALIVVVVAVLAVSGAFGLADRMSAAMATLIRTGALLFVVASAMGFSFATGNALANDVQRVVAAPRTPASRRLIAARLILIGVIAAAGYAALRSEQDPGALVRGGLALSCAALMPAMLARLAVPSLPAGARLIAMALGTGAVAARILSAEKRPFADFSLMGSALAGAGVGLFILAIVWLARRTAKPIGEPPPPPPEPPKKRTRKRAAKSAKPAQQSLGPG